MESKTKKNKKPRVQGVVVLPCKGKVSTHWWVIPLDSKDRVIPSSVDCLYNQEYYSQQEAGYMAAAL